MYTKIAVPLDGSALAEQALPYAVRLANRLNTQLLLLRVVEVSPLLSDTVEAEVEVIRVAESYLAEVCRVLADRSLELNIEPERVQTLAVYGERAREITQVSGIEDIDLIVMTTHGRNWLSRLLLSSIAGRVVQHAAIPVLLIRPEQVHPHQSLAETMRQSTGLEGDETRNRIVVPLDGSAETETAIIPALALAKKLGATSLHLMRVVVPLLPVDYSEFGEAFEYDRDLENLNRREEAYQYLDQVCQQVCEQRFNCVKVVRLGDPASEIIDYATHTPASLLVMATHARPRLGRFFLGSVAEEVVRGTHLPVMLISPEAARAQEERQHLMLAG